MRRVRRIFSSREELLAFLCGLIDVICPACGGRGRMVCHGYIRGWVSPLEHGMRAWRVFCDPDSPRGEGCGHTQSLWLSTTLERRCYSTSELWSFVTALLAGESVRSAWRTCAIALTLRTAYRLVARLESCQSQLRTRLSSRAPPPRNRAAPPGKRSGLLQVFGHLQEAFGNAEPVSAFQSELQAGFLALT